MILLLVRGHYFKMVSKLNSIYETVIRTDTKVKEMHKVMFGNGRPGLVEEHNQMKGGIIIVKWLVGLSLTAGISALGIAVKLIFFPV